MEDQCPAVLDSPLWHRILSFFFPNVEQLTIILPSVKQTILIIILLIIILSTLHELRIEFNEALMWSYRIIAHPSHAALVEIRREVHRATYRQQRLDSRVFEAVEAVQRYREEENQRSAEERTEEGRERETGCGWECANEWHPHPRRKRFRWAEELEIIEEEE